MVKYIHYFFFIILLLGCNAKNNYISSQPYEDYDLDKYINLQVEVKDDSILLSDKIHLRVCIQNKKDSTLYFYKYGQITFRIPDLNVFMNQLIIPFEIESDVVQELLPGESYCWDIDLDAVPPYFQSGLNKRYLMLQLLKKSSVQGNLIVGFSISNEFSIFVK